MLEGFKAYLNLGQKDVAGSFDRWPELQETSTLSLTDGDEEVDLPSDFFKMRTIYISSPVNDERTLKEINYQTFRDTFHNTSDDSESTPLYWYFAPDSTTAVRFFPIPDSSYTATIDYIKVPSDMSATSDTPFFPGRWHHILVDYALSMYYESALESRYDKAAYHRTKYQNDLEKCIADARKRNLKSEALTIDYGTGANE